MKQQAQNKWKAFALLWAALGALFIAGGIAMYILKDSLTQLPRADIAYIGFWIVGAIFFLVGIALFSMAKNKNAIIEETDERSTAITAKAGHLAYIVQTVLFSTALFLLCFMGYMNAVSMIALLCIIAIGLVCYLLSVLYHDHRM